MEKLNLHANNLCSSQAPFGDWRDDFFANGYAVVKGAIPREKALQYQQKAFEWLSSFGTDFNIDDPKTWVKANIPVQSKINTFTHYGVPHEAFVWDAKMEPGVLEAFTKLWGTDELLVSFDALNVTLPNRTDVQPKPSWEHVDQSPLRKGLQCAQGLLNLGQAGREDGSLVVYPGSHDLLEEFFETQTDKTIWDPQDRWLFTQEHLKWFTDRGLKPIKVSAEPGDLIVWDSRTIHWGAEPTKKSNTIRTVIYACYTPAALASPKALADKAKIFHAWGGTTHWPHDNIVFRENKPILDDGSIDPRNRKEPLTKPEMTDRLLQLAGVKSY